MKYFLIVLVTMGITAYPIGNRAYCKGKFPANNLEESHIRAGLPNFFNKILSGHPVRIAYIGGSITEAKDGWRDLTFRC